MFFLVVGGFWCVFFVGMGICFVLFIFVYFFLL